MGKGWKQKRTFEAGESAAWFVWLLLALVAVFWVVSVVAKALGVTLPGG